MGWILIARGACADDDYARDVRGNCSSILIIVACFLRVRRAMARAHAALDAVDARMRDAALQSSSSSRDESYLGEVFRAHDGAAYGYATGTRARFVLGVSDEGSRAMDEREMRRIFDALAEAYAEAVCDVFSERCGRLEGERWRRRVDALFS